MEATSRNLIDRIVDSISITATALGIEFSTKLPLPCGARDRLATMVDAWYEARIHEEELESEKISKPSSEIITSLGSQWPENGKPATGQSACGDDRPNAGCDDTCPPCPHRPEPSAEDARRTSRKILGTILEAMESADTRKNGERLAAKVFTIIESFAAAQRQAGREEAKQEASDYWCAYWKEQWAFDNRRYTALVEAAKKGRKHLGEYLRHLRSRNDPKALELTQELGAIAKALRDLDEAREG